MVYDHFVSSALTLVFVEDCGINESWQIPVVLTCQIILLSHVDKQCILFIFESYHFETGMILTSETY